MLLQRPGLKVWLHCTKLLVTVTPDYAPTSGDLINRFLRHRHLRMSFPALSSRWRWFPGPRTPSPRWTCPTTLTIPSAPSSSPSASPAWSATSLSFMPSAGRTTSSVLKYGHGLPVIQYAAFRRQRKVRKLNFFWLMLRRMLGHTYRVLRVSKESLLSSFLIVT